jgi:hypothetical protein
MPGVSATLMYAKPALHPEARLDIMDHEASALVKLQRMVRSVIISACP